MAENSLTRLLEGRAKAGKDLAVHLSEREGKDLHHKMRQAYWWITNNAVICPYYDIEYGGRSRLKNNAGDEILLHDDTATALIRLLWTGGTAVPVSVQK